ncbi:MAG: hypothetical protein AAGI69_02020 [Cyanobacteria bacterium P01_H01_bin.21]
MYFPLWQYLNQPLWDPVHSSILNPMDYWRRYRRHHLECCLHNAFLEHCWDTNYQNFVVYYHDFCSRHPHEEDPRWLAERCWSTEVRSWTYEHPENRIAETEY